VSGIRGVFADQQAGMAGIKACRPCWPIGKNIATSVYLNPSDELVAKTYSTARLEVGQEKGAT